MGGTSTDVGLVSGAPRRTDQVDLCGAPLLVDALDLQSIGAGGGSILWIDEGGSLRVGPRSAGADPGPACYGRGTLPCLTDAHVVLGRLPISGRLGGAITLDPTRSHAALARLGRRLGVAPVALAAAALEIADAAMEQAIKKMSLERGRDPRELALFSFGGAGGLHACRLARRLEMREVIVPPLPGATSAWGMATSEARLARSRGRVATIGTRLDRALVRDLDDLASAVRRELLEELGPGPLRVERSVACRYHGQSFELEVPFAADLARRFEALHEERYGFRQTGAEIECVALRAAAVRSTPAPRAPSPSRTTSVAPPTAVLARFPLGRELAARRALRFERESLRPGVVLRGPCIVLEPTATTVVEPGFVARVDATGCLRIRARS
jgi:N-methylhydantoinase A